MSTPSPYRSCTCTTDRDVVNISYICSRNLLVLTIMYIFAQISVLSSWQREITSLGISFLYFAGIICNLHIIGEANRQYLAGNVHCVRCLVWILYGIKRVLTRFGTRIVESVEWSSLFLKSLRRSLKKAAKKATRKDGIKTPSPYVPMVASYKSLAQEKSNSEPMRETSRQPSRYASGGIAMKTPELFKHKMYQTRRTLINAQDESFVYDGISRSRTSPVSAQDESFVYDGISRSRTSPVSAQGKLLNKNKMDKPRYPTRDWPTESQIRNQ